MPDYDFQAGDVVEQKSGGPQMTVIGIRTAEDAEVARTGGVAYAQSGVFCGWFAGIKEQRRYFDPETLKKVEAYG